MDREFPLSILNFVTRGDSEKIHWHNYLQVALCTRGTGRFIFTNKEYRVQKGDIFIVSNFENHVAISDLPACTEYIFVLFLPDLIASPGSRQFDFEYLYPFWYNSKTFNNKIDHEEPMAEVLGNKILELKETWDKKEVGYKHCLDADLRKILALLIKHFKTKNPEYYIANKNSHAKMQTALDYINKNFSKNITHLEMAELFHISASRFRHLFKESVHIGFKEYITFIRLTEAKRLLLTTEMNITDIARQSGYTNIHQFYKVFYKYVYISPAKYRNLHMSKTSDGEK
jgi:AraC-like DNA-binding protein